MTFEEIVRAFARSDHVPAAAIRAAEANPQMFVPAAVAMLERIAAGTSSVDEEDGLAVAVHVLADIGDRRVLPPLLNVLRLPRGDLERLLGDTVTDTLGRILIRFALPEDAAAFERVMETLEADEYARGAVFDAWTWLALSGGIDRARAHAYLAGFPARVNPPKGDYTWVSWIDSVAMLGFQDLSSDVERVFAEENIPAAMGIAAMELDDFRQQLDETLTDPEGWKDKQEYTPFSDTVSELSAWYGYSAEYRRRKDEETFDPLAYDEPVINPYRDVGRNDPCPCGSGKKFKKCCLQ